MATERLAVPARATALLATALAARLETLLREQRHKGRPTRLQRFTRHHRLPAAPEIRRRPMGLGRSEGGRPTRERWLERWIDEARADAKPLWPRPHRHVVLLAVLLPGTRGAVGVVRVAGSRGGGRRDGGREGRGHDAQDGADGAATRALSLCRYGVTGSGGKLLALHRCLLSLRWVSRRGVSLRWVSRRGRVRARCRRVDGRLTHHALRAGRGLAEEATSATAEGPRGCLLGKRPRGRRLCESRASMARGASRRRA